MAWARAQGFEGGFIKKFLPGRPLRMWGRTLRTPTLGFGWDRGLNLLSLPQHMVSKPAASRLQAREPCAPVWKMHRAAFRLSSLECQKKGEKYFCSPLAFTLLQLLKSEELVLYVIFSSGKQKCRTFSLFLDFLQF